MAARRHADLRVSGARHAVQPERAFTRTRNTRRRIATAKRSCRPCRVLRYSYGAIPSLQRRGPPLFHVDAFAAADSGSRDCVIECAQVRVVLSRIVRLPRSEASRARCRAPLPGRRCTRPQSPSQPFFANVFIYVTSFTSRTRGDSGRDRRCETFARLRRNNAAFRRYFAIRGRVPRCQCQERRSGGDAASSHRCDAQLAALCRFRHT